MCRITIAVLALSLVASSAIAQEYQAEKFEGTPPAEDLSPEIAGQFSGTGFRVKRGESRTVCEIWPVKELALADVETNDTIQYPLKPGQLLGVLRFRRKTSDFRDQEVSSGLYTMRFGLQPVDGAHVGTSATRDFVLLLPAEQDKSPATIEDYKTLTKTSATASGTSHPAIFSLVKPSAEGDIPSIRHNEEQDWWILRFATPAPDAKQGQIFEMVVVGHAAE
jgi:hypothetical protein